MSIAIILQAEVEWMNTVEVLVGFLRCRREGEERGGEREGGE